METEKNIEDNMRRCPVGSSFVEVLYLYSFVGLTFAGGRLLVA